ncbi:hypothetical protein ACFFX1_49065 [Dactylosporangium sucinum]|uniref:Uncharacterized protein n=1 Tax=Dactylosporangium sucinum TaxID=1424081 RepID=A0A917UE64_9ACTN|nr:hypothetical protein [Dactylosporangium sucinum]GGM86766.1 hypothetical protein GCM10007977_105830 [Dactylosporangium sucinum]
MIVGSLLLIVVAVGLLVLGLLQGSDAMLVASIGASLLAAVALIVGGRQAAAARSARTTRTGRQVPSERYDPMESRIAPDPAEDLDFADLRRARGGERQPVGAGARTGGTYGGPPLDTHAAADETAMMAPVRDEPEAPGGIPQQGDTDRGRYDEYPSGGGYDDDDDDYDDEDPADEPPVQPSSAADVARVATLQTDVFVIDGRPRYHVQGCPHLLGREHEPLPAHEAVELGFTPCSVCTPNDVLLGRR